MLQNQITSQITRAADASFSCRVSNVCSKLSFLQLVASPYLLGNYDSRHTKVVLQSLISSVWQFSLWLNSINQLCFLTLNQRRHLPREGSRRTLCCALFPAWSLKTTQIQLVKPVSSCRVSVVVILSPAGTLYISQWYAVWSVSVSSLTGDALAWTPQLRASFGGTNTDKSLP